MLVRKLRVIDRWKTKGYHQQYDNYNTEYLIAKRSKSYQYSVQFIISTTLYGIKRSQELEQ